MKIINFVYYLLYPFLKLKIKDRLIFFSITLFSIFVIFVDISTLSLLTSVFSGESIKIISKLNSFLKNIYNKLDLTISFFHFQILLISITLILRNIFFIFQDFLVKSFVFSHYNKNSKNLFVLYASSEFIKFYKQGIDYYIKNLNKETWYAYVGILYGILYILIDFIYFLIIVFSGLYLISIENISNIFLSILLFFSLVSVLLIKIKKKGADRMNYEQKYFKDTLNILRSYLEIKVYRKIQFFTDSYSKYLKKFSKALIFQGVANLVPKALVEILAAVTLVYYLIYNNLALNFELLTLVGFILFRLGPVISRIIQNISLIFFYYPSTKILDKEFKEYSKKKEVSLSFKNESSIKKLSINNASFRFGKNKILNNFNYKFIRNNVYGLYGESGKGKSTFLMILSGLIKLDKGNIKINNISYGNKKFYLENRIGFMSQYNVLLDDSLINTIFLESKVNKEKILKAKYYLTKFKLKKLSKFLKEDKNQNYSLNRILSGGERQRLSIIRTILLGGDILFFDEPTSSLDLKNEKIVMKEIQHLKKDKIIIVSTHKKGLKRYFDNIIHL
tara:strand:+ start:55 stop:1740 length:1686 start_codon:yes stop_codon:yes gene_type:complete